MRLRVAPLFAVIVTICLTIGIPLTARAASILVDFNKYADFTPVSAFSEPNVAFASDGVGLARALGGMLQIREGGATVTITPIRTATAIQLDYSLAGACAENAIVELFNGSTLVDSASFGYCAPGGVYQRAIAFDRVVITTPGVSNTEEIRVDNLNITIVEAPTPVPPTSTRMTITPVLPTFTRIPPTKTSVPSVTITRTVTRIPPTATTLPPTNSPVPSTATRLPPTNTLMFPSPTVTSVAPTATTLPPTGTSTTTSTASRTQFPSGYNHFVDFDRYADFTSVTAFSEPDLTFTSNGIGLARALGGTLQIREGGASVTITPARPANAVQFDYTLAGACAESVVIELFDGSSLVDSTSLGYCAPGGVYRKAVLFDRIVITTFGVANTEEIRVDNLGINILRDGGKPSKTPRPTRTPKPTKTPEPTNTPKPTRTPKA